MNPEREWTPDHNCQPPDAGTWRYRAGEVVLCDQIGCMSAWVAARRTDDSADDDVTWTCTYATIGLMYAAQNARNRRLAATQPQPRRT